MDRAPVQHARKAPGRFHPRSDNQVVGFDLRQRRVGKVQVPAAGKVDMKVRAKLRCRRLHLRQVHADGESVGFVEVHDPVHATGKGERIRAALPEERIALRAAHQAIVAVAAREHVNARASVEGVVARFARELNGSIAEIRQPRGSPYPSESTETVSASQGIAPHGERVAPSHGLRVSCPPHGHRSTALLATAFDPLAAARDLKAAGFEPEQAEALAAQLRFAAGADHADLATKADIAALKGDIDALRTETKGNITELRADTQADLAELESRIRSAIQADMAGLRAELGTVRWAVGLIAAFLFVIGLRVFGLI